MEPLSKVKILFLDLLFPDSCVQCQHEGELLCGSCKIELNFIPPTCFVCKKFVPKRGSVLPGRTCKTCRKKTFVSVFLSPFSYDNDVIKRLIQNLKYNRIKNVGPILGRMLAEYLAKFNITITPETFLIPIPIHPARKRRRGFNQSEIIAGSLAKMLKIKVKSDLLQKSKNTKPQVELVGSVRKTNILGTFKIRADYDVKEKTILLLDDVKTTGATLEEAAKTLKAGGAKRIWAITVAH